MPSSINLNRKFYAYTAITFAGASFVAAGFVVPQVIKYVQFQSAELTMSALSGQGSDAAVEYRLAYALDHGNQAAARGLTKVYLANGQAAEALKLLDKIGDSPEGLRLRLHTLTEAGRYDQAKSSADKLASSQNESDKVMAAVVYTLGGYPADLAALDGHISSIEGLQALARLHAGDLPRALELRSLGFPVSSSALLVKLPPSTPRSLALGQMLLQKGDSGSLSDAADYLSAAIKLDPANIELRQVYSQVMRAQNKPSDADAQDKLVLRLRQGKL